MLSVLADAAEHWVSPVLRKQRRQLQHSVGILFNYFL